jgi:beta-glucosidase/6-phospho-beta-glucosidase/beta-galactosidase
MFQVKWWCTLNEPFMHALGYEVTDLAPSLNNTGLGAYLAGHNLLKAHARTYHLYQKFYHSKQKGKSDYHKLNRQKLFAL